MTDRPLFIPLCTEPYEAFENGVKKEELRKYGPGWNEETCRVGRKVTLSKGYGKQHRMTGVIVSFQHQPAYTLCSANRTAVLKHFDTLDIEIAVIGIDLETEEGECQECTMLRDKGIAPCCKQHLEER